MRKRQVSTLLVMIALTTGCGKNSSQSSVTEDSSTSGSVASAVGGAYNGSSTSGTQSLFNRKSKTALDTMVAALNPISSAEASGACPTFTTNTLTSCLSSNQTLVYNGCDFGSSTATWNGSVAFACSGTLGSPTVQRAFTNGTTRTNSYGTSVTLSTSGISTFNGASIPGGGTTITPTSLTIGGVELVASRNGVELYDHTITSSALTASNGTVTGTVTTYHNLAKVIATASVNLTFTVGCCTPTAGTVSTSFAAYGGYTARAGFSGSTESLTFTGCGTAVYTGPEGYSGKVAIANCI